MRKIYDDMLGGKEPVSNIPKPKEQTPLDKEIKQLTKLEKETNKDIRTQFRQDLDSTKGLDSEGNTISQKLLVDGLEEYGISRKDIDRISKKYDKGTTLGRLSKEDKDFLAKNANINKKNIDLEIKKAENEEGQAIEDFNKAFEKEFDEILKTEKNLNNLGEKYAGNKYVSLSPENQAKFDEAFLKTNKENGFKEQKFAESLKKSDNISAEVKAELEKGEYLYLAKSNKESIKKANEKIDSTGLEKSKTDLLSKNIEEFNDDDIFEGIQLGKKLQAESKVDEAVEIYEKLIQAGTQKGREVQAFRTLSIIENMDEQTALYFKQKQIMKEIDKTKPELAKKRNKISESLQEDIKRVNRKIGKTISDELDEFCGF
jgi:hypothetical protein